MRRDEKKHWAGEGEKTASRDNIIMSETKRENTIIITTKGFGSGEESAAVVDKRSKLLYSSVLAACEPFVNNRDQDAGSECVYYNMLLSILF